MEVILSESLFGQFPILISRMDHFGCEPFNFKGRIIIFLTEVFSGSDYTFSNFFNDHLLKLPGHSFLYILHPPPYSGATTQ